MLFLGRSLARLLRQLRPEGGTHAVIAPKAERTEALADEIEEDNDRPDRGHWHEAAECVECPGDGDHIAQMDGCAAQNVTAMIIMRQTPMRHENWTQMVDRHRHRNITYVGTDGADYQLAYLDRRCVDGLVGQLPFEFGTEAFKVSGHFLVALRCSFTAAFFFFVSACTLAAMLLIHCHFHHCLPKSF